MAMIQALGNVSKVRGALIFVEDTEAELVFYESAFIRPDADPERLPA